jgi:hypothetical protein
MVANKMSRHGIGDHRNPAPTRRDEGRGVNRIEHVAAWPMGGC